MTASPITPNRRVLIVDDNPAVHDDYKKILVRDTESDGDLDDLSALVFGDEQKVSDIPLFELHSALQGQEALRLVEKSIEDGAPYSMAFVDMRMPPGWDGLETIEHLWKADPRLQIVICTAYSDYSWSEIIERVEYRDRLLILKKPFDNVEVCQLALSLTNKWDLERLAEAEIRSIIETAADGIVTLRHDGEIESTNQAACDMFGVERSELVGATFREYLAPENRGDWDECLRELQAPSGACVQAREVEGSCSDGTNMALLLSASTFSVPDGVRYTVILHNLTEYKALQASVAESQRLESVGQLAAGVAHEINTPLQFICSNSEFIQDCLTKLFSVLDTLVANVATDSPAKSWEARWKEMRDVMQANRFEMVRTEAQNALAESLEGLERVVSIVRTMKELTHPGMGDKSKCDLNHIIDGAVTITRNHWKDVATVDVQTGSGDFEAEGIAGDLNRVLVNLIVNATDAICERYDESNQKSGLITIRTSREPEHAVITVADNGTGIPETVCEKVFDPFFTTKEVGKGTGQGLAIAYNIIVKNHGGTIDFESKPAEGTKFVIRLPWKGAPANTQSAPITIDAGLPQEQVAGYAY